MLSSLFSFQGRITRRRLLASLAGSFLVIILGTALITIGAEPEFLRGGLWPWLFILLIGQFLAVAAAGFWRRSQDVGWPGQVGLLPGVNFVLLALSGTSGPNAYGPDPRQPGLTAAAPPLAQPRPGNVASPSQPPKDRPREGAQIRRFVCSSCGASNRQAASPGAATCDYCGGPN